MRFALERPVKIVMLGAGGTGGHIAPHLYRLLHALDRPVWMDSEKYPQELPILIGAVDNNRSRQLCHQVFQKSEELVYIDSGNGEYTGQVVCGIRLGGKTSYKPVG